MITLIIAVILVILAYCLHISSSKYKTLAVPGVCLPVIGHCYKLMSKDVMKDPVNGFWDLYKKFNRAGILYIKTFKIETIWIGDFETAKYVLNLPEAQDRLNDRFLKLALPTRKVKGPHMPGILMSEGHVWQQQRRFALRTLRDFGFGKQGTLP